MWARLALIVLSIYNTLLQTLKSKHSVQTLLFCSQLTLKSVYSYLRSALTLIINCCVVVISHYMPDETKISAVCSLFFLVVEKSVDPEIVCMTYLHSFIRLAVHNPFGTLYV